MSTNMDIQTAQATLSVITSASQTKTVNGSKSVTDGKELPQTAPNVAQVVELPNRDNVSRAIENLNDYTQNLRRQLNFSVDEVTGRTVIRVIDAETQETIRQIPAEEVLVLAREMRKSGETGEVPSGKKGVFLQVMV
jgi:flagellar protein FlaG